MNEYTYEVWSSSYMYAWAQWTKHDFESLETVEAPTAAEALKKAKELHKSRQWYMCDVRNLKKI